MCYDAGDTHNDHWDDEFMAGLSQTDVDDGDEESFDLNHLLQSLKHNYLEAASASEDVQAFLEQRRTE